MADFDISPDQIAAARAEGYSDRDILDFVGKQFGLADQIKAARKEGYSDTDIVSYLVPPPKEETPRAPAIAPTPAAKKDESGTIGGMLKAAGQSALSIPGKAAEMLGSTLEVGSLLDKVASRREGEVYDRVKAGEEIKPGLINMAGTEQGSEDQPPMDFGPVAGRGDAMRRQELIWANRYKGADPEQREAMEQHAKDVVNAPADLIQSTGQAMRRGGEAEMHWAEKAIPLTDEEKSRASVQFVQMAASMVPYFAAAVATGGPGVFAYGVADGLNRTYTEAVNSGADPERAAVGAVQSGAVNAALNLIPAAQATRLFEALPAGARNKFVKGLAEAVMGATNQIGMSQLNEIAENAIAAKTYEPDRPWDKNLGEGLELQGAVGASTALTAMALGAGMRRLRGSPRMKSAEEVGKTVMDAPDLEGAVTLGKQELDNTINQLRELGTENDRAQAETLDLFSRGDMSGGKIQETSDGNYFWVKDDKVVNLKPWDGTPGEGKISPELAQAQRDIYGKMGFDIVYIDDANTPFDGAVLPDKPNTIFLSTKTDRNVAMVGAHEVGHLLENVRLPDGTNLGSEFIEAVRRNVNDKGLEHAIATFDNREGAPRREQFGEGREGDAAFARSRVDFLIRELAADTHGEMLAFSTFMPKVIDQVQARYGADTAKGVLRQFLDGLRESMQRMREMFFGGREAFEYGPRETVSQHWFTNIEEIHDIGARIYAEKFGTQAEKENATLRQMRERVQRERMLQDFERPAAEVPPPTAPAGFTDGQPRVAPDVTAAAPEAPAPAPIEPQRPSGPPLPPSYAEAVQRAAIYRRWLSDLDAQRRADAPESPEAKALQDRIDTILSKVKGNEDRLTDAARDRLEAARTALDQILDPVGDSPDMARVRAALEAEQQRMADAAAVGTPSPGMERAIRPGPSRRGPRPRPAEPMRGEAIMPRSQEPFVPAPSEAVEGVPLDGRVEVTPAPEAPISAPENEPLRPVPAPAVEPTQLQREQAAIQTMAGRQPGAEEATMRREVGPFLDMAADFYGVPGDHAPEIATIYGQLRRQGMDPETAYERAAERFIDQREREAIVAEAQLDPDDQAAVRARLAEVQQRAENGRVENDIPFPTSRAAEGASEGLPGGEVAGRAQGGEGLGDRGRLGGEGRAEEVPAVGEAEGQRLDQGPLFSPRVRDDADAADITRRAKDLVGITSNPREAGYVTRDGQMLDMSGRHWDETTYERQGDRFVPRAGQRDWVRDQRQVDHRDVAQEVTDGSGTDAMREFMDRSGAIRVDFNAGVVSASVVPSQVQMEAVAQAARRAGLDRLSVERVDAEGSTVSHAEIENITPRNLARVFNESMQGETLFSPRQTETPEFRQWFGKSKVRDDEGRPLRLYHGTSDSVQSFDLDHPNRKDTGWLGTGVYLTNSPSLANSYSMLKRGSAGENVMPLYARMENPYHATLANKERFMLLARRNPEEARLAADAWTRDLRAQGYDGVVLEYPHKGGPGEGKVAEYVVFDPAAVKSASGNRGTFDRTNPDIAYSPRKRENGGIVFSPEATAEADNRPGVVVGGLPGRMSWSFSDPDAVPPPIQHPTARGPRVEKMAPAVEKILRSKGFKDLAKDVTGVEDVEVTPGMGTWEGVREPSFTIRGKGLTDEGADRLARLLGFAFSQDSVVTLRHSPAFQEGRPTLYVGGERPLSAETLNGIVTAAQKRGLDLSTSADGTAVKFIHFGEEADVEKFTRAVVEVAGEAGLPPPVAFRTRSDLHEASAYGFEQVRGAGEGDGLSGGGTERSDLLRRAFDHLVVPYSRAVAGEGYRLSPDRFAERFGLGEHERELLREKLRPTNGTSRSTVPLMTGAEKVAVEPTTVVRTKGGGTALEPNVTDAMWFLQNRAARKGIIEPGDYSPKAKRIIAQTIVDEINHHIQTSKKSAIGWYDAALKRAKEYYAEMFPQIRSNPDKAMLFDAVLGITSQGNDVHSNSIFATRVFKLLEDGRPTGNHAPMSISEVVDTLKGTFGNQTRAIELNLLKLEHLLETNGYERMRQLFNEKMTVSEWNKRLREDPSLFGPNGKPLSVEGAAPQMVTGWMVFGPKIGSFINNLHGDYSTLTADLWFSRTWNRMLGFSFQHVPQKEAAQYQEFKDALLAEWTKDTGPKMSRGKPVMKDGKEVPWLHGNDLEGMSKAEVDRLVNDPQAMLDFANAIEESYRTGGYKEKSDLRRRAKNWIESRYDPHAAPRSDLERHFQQQTMEAAQAQLKKQGVDISIADMQAALWYYEKELFEKLGVNDGRAAPADYADAGANTMKTYMDGDLFGRKAKKAKGKKGEEASSTFVDYIGGSKDAFYSMPEKGADATAPSKEEPQFSPRQDERREPAPVFYSGVERAVQGAKLDKAAPGQWLGTLKNMPGVKPEEVQWLGLDDWLKSQPKSVTKQEVLDYVRANQIEVREVEKGSIRLLRDDVARRIYGADETYDSLPTKLQWKVDEWIENNPEAGGTTTKFGQYTLPGGENYRELLLTLPSKERAPSPEIEAARTRLAEATRAYDDALLDQLNETPRLTDEQYRQADQAVNDARRDLTRAMREDDRAAENANYKSSHWDEPNVLAHIRFDDRTGPNGERVLHVAEVQSDWHQEGRKRGYNVEPQPGKVEPQEHGFWKVTWPDGTFSGGFGSREAAEAHAASKTERAGVPDAPFKTSWPELAMKRVIRYAAENGYDRVLWDTGATNAERYDLSKQISKVTLRDNSTGGVGKADLDGPFSFGKLTAFDYDGKKVINDKWIDGPEELANTIGKEAADKLLNAKANEVSVAGLNARERSISGLDLKVGGEGMAAFYDRQLPLVANKLGKKFGAKVEAGEVPGTDAAAHSLPITDAMRQAVVEEGQPLFSPRTKGTDTYTPAEKAAAAAVRGAAEKSFLDRFEKLKDRPGTQALVQTVDPYAGITDRESYLALRNANSTTGAQKALITQGTIGVDKDGTPIITKFNGGLKKIFDDLGADVYRWADWIAANRAEQLSKEERERLYTPEAIKTLKGLIKGEMEADYTLSNGKTTRSREAAFLDALARYDEINKSVKDLGVNTGMISRKVVDELWSNPFYLPFFRQAGEDGTTRFQGPTSSGGMTRQVLSKKLKGGTEKLNEDLLENIEGNMRHMVDASIRNNAANITLRKAEADGIAARISEADYNAMTKAEKADVTWTMVDGEKQYWRVDDPLALTAIEAVHRAENSIPFIGILRGAKKLLQTGVAVSPLFQLKNLARDATNSIAISPLSYNVFKNVYSGMRQQDVQGALADVGWAVLGRKVRERQISEETAQAMAGGATMEFGSGTGNMFRGSYLDTPSKLGKFGEYFRNLTDAYEQLSTTTENNLRLALYEQQRAQGKSHAEAAFSGRDLNDYTLRGASPVVRFFLESVPFLNPWMQGLYKVGRTATDKDINTRLRLAGMLATMAGLVAINDAFYADDKDYKARNEDDRNANFWFKFNGQEYRIPMGFEVAALARMAANWGEALYAEDMSAGRAWKNTLKIMGNTMGLDPTPQLIKPMLDLKANKSRTGAPIETTGMERLRPEYRTGANTTQLAQWLSEGLNKAWRGVRGPTGEALSPVQIDYLIQGYSAWLGTTAMQVVDEGLRMASGEPEKPARDWLGSFTGGMVSETPSSQRGATFYTNLLYEQGQAIQQAYATFNDLAKRGRTAEAREYLEDNRDLIKKYPIYSQTIRLEGEINQQIRTVTESRTLTPEQKRVRIMQLNAMKTRAAENVFRAVNQ